MTGGDGATTEAVPCMACGRLLRDEEDDDEDEWWDGV